MPNQPTIPDLKMRITGLRWEKADSLLPAPLNPNQHPETEHEVLREVMDKFGFAGAMLVWERPDKKLELLDGHLRKEEVGDLKVPVLVTDFTEAEARAFVAVVNEVARFSRRDHAMLKQAEEVLRAIAPNLLEMMNLTEPSSYREIIELKPPPTIIWCLLAIPFAKYPEAQAHVAALEAIADITVQTTRTQEATDGVQS